MKRKRAFTLIELIICISILSILLVIAAPKTNIYSSYLKNRELQNFRRDLNTARTKAVAENTIITLYFLHGESGYILESSDNKYKKRVELEHIKILTTPTSSLYFLPSGSFSSPRTIIIEDYDKVKYGIKIAVGTSKVTLEKVDL